MIIHPADPVANERHVMPSSTATTTPMTTTAAVNQKPAWVLALESAEAALRDGRSDEARIWVEIAYAYKVPAHV